MIGRFPGSSYLISSPSLIYITQDLLNILSKLNLAARKVFVMSREAL